MYCVVRRLRSFLIDSSLAKLIYDLRIILPGFPVGAGGI